MPGECHTPGGECPGVNLRPSQTRPWGGERSRAAGTPLADAPVLTTVHSAAILKIPMRWC